MSWVKLDDRFFDNAKIAGITDSAKVAYLKSVTYCARTLSDGEFPIALGREFAGGRLRVVKEIEDTGLWEREATCYRVHDYLDYNPSRAEVMATRQERSKAGSKGAANRWQVAKQTDGKPDAPLPVPVNPVPNNPDPSPPTTDPEQAAAVKEFWEGRIGPLSPRESTELESWTRKVGEEWVYEAIEETEEKAETPWPYFDATLKRCLIDQRSPKGKRKPKTKVQAGSARSQILARAGIQVKS